MFQENLINKNQPSEAEEAVKLKKEAFKSKITVSCLRDLKIDRSQATVRQALHPSQERGDLMRGKKYLLMC